jgi:hypothetical protein
MKRSINIQRNIAGNKLSQNKMLFYDDETVFWWRHELERIMAGVFEV